MVYAAIKLSFYLVIKSIEGEFYPPGFWLHEKSKSGQWLSVIIHLDEDCHLYSVGVSDYA